MLIDVMLILKNSGGQAYLMNVQMYSLAKAGLELFQMASLRHVLMTVK